MSNIQSAYTGDEKYIFISYSHKDTDRVYPIIAKMQEEGYRVWYDEGIDLCKQFVEVIADRIFNCTCFVAFVSNEYQLSDFCNKEFEYANSKKKELLCIILKDTVIQRKFDFLTVNIQYVDMAEYESNASFYAKLFSTPALNECKDVKANSYTDGMEFDYGIYVGEIKDGIPHGKGKLTYANGDIYEGDFTGGNRTGKGKLTYANGDIYEGDWKNGTRTGKGKLTYANGDIYEGDWKNGTRTGKGKLIYANGDVYDGDWESGKRTGKGKLIYANGDIYEGDWESGKRTGKGKFLWADGMAYDGEIKNGKPHGHGKMIYPDGRVEEGRWENDVFVG